MTKSKKTPTSIRFKAEGTLPRSVIRTWRKIAKEEAQKAFLALDKRLKRLETAKDAKSCQSSKQKPNKRKRVVSEAHRNALSKAAKRRWQRYRDAKNK